MAIAQTAWATQGENDNSPVTMNFDCNGGNLLVLGVYTYGARRAGGAPTYNGITMTDSGEGIVDSGIEAYIEMWYLVNPAGGTNAISIPNTAPNHVAPIASAWSGVDTIDPFDVSGSAFNGGSANPSCMINTANAFELVIDVMMSGHPDVPTGNSHTLITSDDWGSRSSNAQYTTGQTPAGNITLHWTVLSDDWAQIVCAFKVAVAAELPTRDEVLTMDYSQDGRPFCQVASKSGVELDGLDYSMIGSPWWGLEDEAPPPPTRRVFLIQ